MPAKQGKSGFMAKNGAKLGKAVAATKDNETKYSAGGSLPPFENGIAQLVECKLDQYKTGASKGEYYFLAAGIMKLPKKTAEGIPIEGQRIQIMEPLCETPTKSRKTFQDHVDWVLNEFRKLGVDTSSMADDGSDFEATCEALKSEMPHFRCRAWKGAPATEGKYKGKEPLTNYVFEGAVDFTEGDEESPVDDATGGDDAPADEAPADEPADETAEEVDLDALAKLADKNDDPAQVKLSEIAREKGLDPEDAAYKTWKLLVAAIKAVEDAPADEEGGDEGGDEPAEEYIPTKDDVVFFKPTDPKTKKPVKKAIECSVTAVNVKAQTVALKNLDDGKTVYKDIKWDALLQEAS